MCVYINRSHIAVLRVEQTMALINRPIAPSYMATTSYPPGLQANTGTQQTYLHWTDVGQPGPCISLHSGQASSPHCHGKSGK